MPRKSNAVALDRATFIPAKDGERLDVHRDFPAIRRVISVTGSSSNAGKTWTTEAAVRTLRALGVPTTALKITRTHIDRCPRHNTSCGTCDSLAEAFEIIEDRARLDVPKKDTGRYFLAGADQVLWLLVRPDSMASGLRTVLAKVNPGHVLIVEGNSYRDYASADWTVMAVTETHEVKPSAHPIAEKVDLFVTRPSELDRVQALPLVAGQKDRVVTADTFERRTAAWWVESCESGISGR